MAATAAGRLTYDALPGRVVLGAGAVVEVPAEVERLGMYRVLVLDGLVDTEPAERLAAALGDRCAGRLGGARQHVPADTVVTALEAATAVKADGVVALGGGSAIGLAKALARETGVVIVAVPTTYAGSEMTPIWGVSDGEAKTTGTDLAVLPRSVIYDPELTRSLPPAAAAASGLNAMAHCVEALWTARATPVSDAVATEGISLLARALPAIVADPDDTAARETALRGAWLGGSALAMAGTALHHKLCHVLGGTFDLPHAETHAMLLPEVAEAFRAHAPQALDRTARALGAEDAVAGLRRLRDDMGLGQGLAALGLDTDGLGLAAEQAAAQAPPVPAELSAADVGVILERAMWPTRAPGRRSDVDAGQR